MEHAKFKNQNQAVGSMRLRLQKKKEIISIEQIGVLPEFVKSSLDEEESSHMDYDDDFRQLLIIFDYPSAENEDDDSIDSTIPHCQLVLSF